MTGKRKYDARLQDDAFGEILSGQKPLSAPNQVLDTEEELFTFESMKDLNKEKSPGGNIAKHAIRVPHNDVQPQEDGTIDEEEMWDDGDLEESGFTNSTIDSDKVNSAKRRQIVLALGLGTVAVLVIIGLLWKMTMDSNGFRAAKSAPIPAEPIDIAEKENRLRSQPTDYADEEQMRTMNYDGVNSIYGLALKQQEENRKNKELKDTIRQDASVQGELDRSRQLTRPQQTRRKPNGRITSNQRPREDHVTSDDPFRNKVRDEYLMRAGFNTVKAEEGNSGNQMSVNQYSIPNKSDKGSHLSETNDPVAGVVSGDQTIANGSRVIFRTLTDAMIGGRYAPKGSILVGFAQINNNRALFNITTLRLIATGEAVPIRMKALDLDMNEGLAVQSEKPFRQQADQATNNALSQAAGQAAWSAGYSLNRATKIPAAGNALASLGAGLASAATTGRRREVRQKLHLQDGFKVFFVPAK